MGQHLFKWRQVQGKSEWNVLSQPGSKAVSGTKCYCNNNTSNLHTAYTYNMWYSFRSVCAPLTDMLVFYQRDNNNGLLPQRLLHKYGYYILSVLNNWNDKRKGALLYMLIPDYHLWIICKCHIHDTFTLSTSSFSPFHERLKPNHGRKCVYLIVKIHSSSLERWIDSWKLSHFPSQPGTHSLNEAVLSTTVHLEQGCSIRRSRSTSRSRRSIGRSHDIKKIGPPPCNFLYSARLQQK